MGYAREAVLYVAAPLAPTGSSATVWSTASIQQDGAVEIQVGFRAVMGSVMSLDPEIRAFRSLDGGANFESFPIPYYARTVGRNPSSSDRLTFSLPGGYWVFACQPGTPNTATVAIDTCRVISAYVSG